MIILSKLESGEYMIYGREKDKIDHERDIEMVRITDVLFSRMKSGSIQAIQMRVAAGLGLNNQEFNEAFYNY